MRKILILLATGTFLLSGCATTTGPKITSLEVKEAKERLEAKAVRHRFAELERVANVGYRLIKNLLEEDRRKDTPFLGIKAANVNKVTGRAYNLSVDEGMVVIAVVEGSPAEKADFGIGDVILRIGGKNYKGA